MTPLSKENLYAVTQSIIAVAVIVGGGFLFATNPQSQSTVAGIVGIVIGYYFREASIVQAQSETRKISEQTTDKLVNALADKLPPAQQ